MSRRRGGFETSLSSSSSRTNGRNATNLPAPPAIPTPKAEEPTPIVPTGSNGTSAEETVVTAETTPEEELDDDNSTCFICAEPITFWSTGVCKHKTCHICALRLRIFYKKIDCTYCKTVQPSLYFSRSPKTPFPEDHRIKPSPAHLIAAAQANADKLPKGERWDKGLILPGKLDMADFEFKDEKLSVVFEDADMMDATLLLLRFNCPYPDCPHMSDGWPNLQKHTISIHGLSLCTICCRALSRFAHEQVLYPPHLLALHDPSRLQKGQRPPKPKGRDIELVKSWDAPHPICEFCHEAFFSPDELFSHMRTKHDECFVCKDLGERNVYFQNYAKLEEHFNGAHFPCRQPACLEQKFVVFGSELDLRAHMIEEHKGAMSQREQAQSRQINVDFSHDQSHRAGSSRAGQGRGFSIQQRDAPHGQQLSAHAPMGPAQAAQAKRQAQADRHDETHRRRGKFNTNLTDTHREPEDENLGSGFNTPREDVDEATAMRHAALLSRVSMMVSDSNTKMSSFRAAIRAFKMTESTAQNMIDTIYNVLDRDAQATISVTKEIGQIFEEDGDRDKAMNVLEAMNGFRAQQEQQFPSLAAGPSGLGSNWAGITSGQILRAKNTTHTSGRSTNSRNVWERVAAAAASEHQHPNHRPAPANQRYPPGSRAALASPASFPTLAQAPASSGGGRPIVAAHSTPWASGGAGSNSKAPSALAPQIQIKPTTSTSSTSSTNFPQPKNRNTKPPSQSAFPSLPTSTKASISAQERKALFSKPNPRQESIRRITGGGSGSGSSTPQSSQGWGNGGVNGTSEAVEALSLDEQSQHQQQQQQGQEGGGSRKKGKQKQILFSVSARPQ